MSNNAFLTIQWNGDKSALKAGLGIMIERMGVSNSNRTNFHVV